MDIQKALMKEKTAAGKEPAHILVVDDAFVTRAILEKVLSGEYRVYQAADGVQALELLHTEEISLVLSDVFMPNMSGIELLKEMHSDLKLAPIPVMMITADENPEHITEALSLGAVDVIRKPFVPQILLARVRNLLGLQASYRAAEQLCKNQEELAAQAENLRRAEHDDLTGTLTAQAFYSHVRTFLNEHLDGDYEIIRLDLDNFSTVNDIMGVQAGDHLLSDIGSQAVRCCEEYDDVLFVGHVGADHFVCLHECSGTPAEQLFALMQGWIIKHEKKFNINSRCGVYRITDKNMAPSVMCDRALMALKSTKGNFTKRFARYDESMRKTLLEEQALAAEMMPALNSGQFEVYYQPQVNYSNSTLIGAEALVRWNHPKRGLLMPSVFLPLFESNGLVTRLDYYVWDQTAKQIGIWHQKYGTDCVPVSINISRVDIYGDSLCSRLKKLVEKYKIPTELLRLEITESAYVNDGKRLISIVEELSKAGFVIEMDDFGSAYSSLNMLKDIEVDVLKLDMKFLSNTRNSVRSGNILSSVVRMARWLQLPVIAEGVETKSQADYLNSIGCFYMQGFYFSRAITKERFEEFLSKHEIGSIYSGTSQDISAAESFWDASNQTALIFNSYVGGAVIVQQRGEKLEMLRANEEFFHVMHTTREEYTPFMLDVWRRFPPEAQKAYNDMLNQAASGAADASCEICSYPIGHEEGDWTRNRAKLLAAIDGSAIFYISVENITAEKKAMKELNRLYNLVPCGIIDFAINGNEVGAVNYNDTVWKMFGCHKRSEFSGLKTLDTGALVHPDDISKIKRAAEHVIRYHSSATEECRLKRMNGTYFWAEVRMQYTEHPSAMQCIFIDVSDRHEQEAQKYLKLMFSLFDVVLLLDHRSDTCQVLKSSTRQKNTGEIVKNSQAKYMDWIQNNVIPSDRDKAANLYHEQSSSDKQDSSSLVIGIKVKDGTIRHIKARVIAIDENRSMVCYQDITAEMQAADQSRKIAVLQATLDEEERYRIIVEKTGAAVIELNHRTGEYFHSSTFAKYDISRVKVMDILSDSLPSEVNTSEDLLPVKKLFEQCKAGRNCIDTDLKLKMKDGTSRWTRISVTSIKDQTGQPLRTIGTFKDIDDEVVAEEKLKETDERLTGIIANISSGIGIYTLDEQDHIVPIYISDRTCSMFGFTKEECDRRIGNRQPVNFAPDIPMFSVEKIRQNNGAEPMNLPKMKAYRKDGSWFWLRLTCSFVVSDHHQIVCYTVLSDITNMVEAEQQADYDRELNQILIESTETVTFDYSVSSDLLKMSFVDTNHQRIERQYPDFTKTIWSDHCIVAPVSRQTVYDAMKKASSVEMRGDLDYESLGPDYNMHWYHAKYLSLTESGAVYRIVGRIDNYDSVIEAQQKKLAEAQIDQLNGLMNKDAARKAISELMKQRTLNQIDTILFVDIDDFKEVNDTYGHLKADHVLAALGKMLKESFPSPAVPARFGGDEFMAYLPDCSGKEKISEIAETLLEKFHKTEIEEHVSPGCSIGAVEISGPMVDFESIYKCADRAMYHAKKTGKDRFTIVQCSRCNFRDSDVPFDSK